METSSNITPSTSAGAVDADTLKSIETELFLGFNFERYNIPFDQIDLEHFRNALASVRSLLASRGPVFAYPKAERAS